LGENGIVPAERFVSSVKEQIGMGELYRFPTLFYFDASPITLKAVCGGGIFLSLILIIGLVPVPALLLLWFFYLSLFTVSHVFLSFQWDILLLEIGLLAFFIAPFQWKPKIAKESNPPALMIFLFQWLLFRLMFSSGVVKLLSGDPTWHDLTALNFHYETQPLPTWASWYVHQLPEWFQRFSVFSMFVIELGIPFFIFAPRRMRYFAGLSIVGFQILIIATGNYCFFNLLTVLLCFFLFDDSLWPSFIQKKIDQWRDWSHDYPSANWPGLILKPVFLVIFVLSIFTFGRTLRWSIPWPSSFNKFVTTMAPFHFVSGYGLFAVMTTTRPEIIVEGSNDGRVWRAYEFKYKPGDLARRPEVVAPHQPRLDWQMWFAALGNVQNPRNQWFVNFCIRLLQGSSEVLSLLEENPFPEGPPKYIRAQLYRYRFTTWGERKKTGNWWKRDYQGEYLRPLSLR